MSSKIQSTLIQDSEEPSKESCQQWCKIKAFLLKNFLTVGLLLALFVGLTYPSPGDIIASQKMGDYNITKTMNICTIFFISGMTLRSSEIKAAFSAYSALAYSLITILFITPFAGFAFLKIPYNPQEFAIGLAVFCAVPTTLTSGATLAMQANGNYALALMITVSSNVLGVITVPFVLKLILEGVVQGLQIDAIQLLTQLLSTILFPLIVGKIFRHLHRNIMNFGKKYKSELSLINNGSLVMIVWQTISESQQTIINTNLISILLLILSGILMHLVFFGFNYMVVKIIGWGEKEKRAVLLIASQKTLPVAVTIISYFGASVGNKGLITLPCILAYLAQLFIDSFVVSRWTANDAKSLINQNNQKDEIHQNVCDVKKSTDDVNFVGDQVCDLEAPLLIQSLDNGEGSSNFQTAIQNNKKEIFYDFFML
eukprot:TRINITY_DN471_c0_g1_i10.p1 TRINITY_DN471_c0_g1~~TRINITY_DN471_c0_g1_i10.p1  ORF type:complete len:427 (+),score=41.90 TRINITY_DN471_c0_g1_i10:121-1401(+)